MASVVHSNLSCRFRSLKKGNPRSPSLDKNRFKAAYKLLDVLDGSWSIHGHDGVDLFWIGLNSSVTDDKSE